MYIRFDYRCPSCGFQEERFVKKVEMDEQMHYYCKGKYPGTVHRMTRLPAAPRTTFRFHDKKLKD